MLQHTRGSLLPLIDDGPPDMMRQCREALSSKRTGATIQALPTDTRSSILSWTVQAVLKFNLQRVLSDPSGEQDRPLVVRRANMRKPAASLMMGQSGLQTAAGLHSSMHAAGMSSNSAFSSGSNLATGMSGLSVSGGPSLELQQPGSLQQLGLGAPQGPFLLQPMISMQVC